MQDPGLPPLNALRAFEAAGRGLSFRAAADALGVTQGAVAQQVRGLEAQLGLALFHRLPKGLSLTDAGVRYLAEVQGAFETIRRATADLRQHPQALRLSVTPSFASKWLLPRLPSFAESHPGMDLHIHASEAVSPLGAGGVDLAVRQLSGPLTGGLRADLLFAGQVIAVASPDLMRGRALPLAQGAFAAFALLDDAHGHWPAFLGPDVRPVTAALRFNQTALAIDAAIAGQGIALASRCLVADALASARLVQVSAQVLQTGRDFYVVSQRLAHLPEPVRALRDWLLAEARQEAGA
ncbi:LysR substrate-binding domain-containing protein [Gemmobacter fulvus]|uniref:LysR substrate-binding domain-containing protein n=1 Tax=Gemmobacter fulvus TaxID=2840474 RepID=UPI00279660C8|nr:LysR substrate-binding domain-containing protein [Gemmobacter fulvus]MDQ1848794.1 LysR substrate-binding domain-containing protein [Gemmobacter fulvus]